MSPNSGAPLSVRELPALLRRVFAALEQRREVLDELNVFPVPDGDTGTNMLLTVRAGLDALDNDGAKVTDDLSRDVIRAVVGGARGNSGVILSQVIRAVVEVVAGHSHVDARLYAQALAAARDLAYEAIAEPVEGTMLTAITAAAQAAEAAASGGADLVTTSASTCRATAVAVEETPNQLAVLRDAGVVDAGARGFEIVLAAVHGHLTGHEPEVVRDNPRPLAGSASVIRDPGGQHAFEVQYLLDAHDADAGPLRIALEQIGDSVAVVAAGDLLNVHVHTNDVGAAIEAGVALGTPSSIDVTHFGDQIARRAARQRNPIGMVAVVSGAGLTKLAHDLGAIVVEGTSGELPSVDALHAGIHQANAEHVIVLPGHRNSMAAAQQAAAIAEHEQLAQVAIVPAESPPAVIAALAVFDPHGVPAEIQRQAEAAASHVCAGEIVRAQRDAQTPVGAVEAGHPLALRSDGTVVSLGLRLSDVVGDLCRALDAAQAEAVTVLLGADLAADERHAVEADVRAVAATADIEVIDAGQRPALLWIGVE